MNEFDATLALRAPGLLGEFNRAGLITAADVHVAVRVGALAGESDDAVLLALALTVRSTRHGSVVLDLDTAAATTAAADELDVLDGLGGLAERPELRWPEQWVERCRVSPLLRGALQLQGSRLWLARYWQQEQQVATELRTRAATRPDDIDPRVLAEGLHRLFPGRTGSSGSPQAPDADADQRLAAAVCALSRVSVLAGGPGTGKTTTVSRVLALLREQDPAARIALAAPTGKAAARLEHTVRSSLADLPEPDARRVGSLPATTLHRLLGWRPDARSRFRRDAGNRLPVDVVVVDEASMIPLTMMARLLEALRPQTRLVLVGDPDQLASVEAGAVLGDLVGPAAAIGRTPGMAEALREVLPAGEVEPPVPETPAARLRDGIAVLVTNRRFAAGGAIGELAAAVREGDEAGALRVLRSPDPQIEFVEVAEGTAVPEAALDALRADLTHYGALLHDAAAAGDDAAALEVLDRHRLLCAHRTGPRGVGHWEQLASRWIAQARPVEPRADGHHVGQPLLVTENDYELGLYNGDSGVVSAHGSELVAVFARAGEPLRVPLARLGSVRPLHALTVHRSQGSQFERVSLILPPADSPLATRETLYTAVTRARGLVRIVGSTASFLAAVGRPAARATGLRERLERADAR